MRMGAAPPSSAPKSLLAVSGESESEVQLPRFDSPCARELYRSIVVVATPLGGRLTCIHTLDTHYCMNQSFNLMKWSFLKEKSDPSRPFGKAKAWEGTAAATAPTRETDAALRAWLGRGHAPKGGSARQFGASTTVREKPRLGPTRLYKTNQISMLKFTLEENPSQPPVSRRPPASAATV